MSCGGAVLLLVPAALGEQQAFPLRQGAGAAWLYLVAIGSLGAFSGCLQKLARMDRLPRGR